MTKLINTRISHKHDSEVNWLANSSFIPLSGEIIIYDPDANFDYPRFKIGDGKTAVGNLSWAIDKAIQTYLDTRLFVGTRAAYELADSLGAIALGAIVILTDDEEASIVVPPTPSLDGTSSLLGTGVLGQMILG